MNVAPAGALFTLLRVLFPPALVRASALACGVCVLTTYLYRAGVKGVPRRGYISNATPSARLPRRVFMLGPSTCGVENTVPLGIVDTGTGPTPILTRRNEPRMNHDHLLRINMSTWQMPHPQRAVRVCLLSSWPGVPLSPLSYTGSLQPPTNPRGLLSCLPGA
jgi:hypothetical protein